MRTCKPEWWVHVYMWMNTPMLMCGTSEHVVCWWWLWVCVACVLGQVVGAAGDHPCTHCALCPLWASYTMAWWQLDGSADRYRENSTVPIVPLPTWRVASMKREMVIVPGPLSRRGLEKVSLHSAGNICFFRSNGRESNTEHEFTCCHSQKLSKVGFSKPSFRRPLRVIDTVVATVLHVAVCTQAPNLG